MAVEGTLSDDGLCMGTYSSIYAVNAALPGGGKTGQYVMIGGLAHYWNADRGTWCVNEQRDDYWDSVIQMMGDRMTTAENGLLEETKARLEAVDGLKASMETEVRKTVNKTVAQEIMNRKAAVAQESVERKKADAALREAIEALGGGSGSLAWEETARELEASIAEERRLRQAGDNSLEESLAAVDTALTAMESAVRQATSKATSAASQASSAESKASAAVEAVAQERAERKAEVEAVAAKAAAASTVASAAAEAASSAESKASAAVAAVAQEVADRKAAVEAVDAKVAEEVADRKAAVEAVDVKASAAVAAAEAAKSAVAQETEDRKADLKALKAKTVVLTEEEYEALATKDADTFYYTYSSD